MVKGAAGPTPYSGHGYNLKTAEQVLPPFTHRLRLPPNRKRREIAAVVHFLKAIHERSSRNRYLVAVLTHKRMGVDPVDVSEG